MELDNYTLFDLNIFEAQANGQSLFSFCDLTATAGGSQALRQRMTQPSSNIDKIRATQLSITYINDNPHSFNNLPNNMVMKNAENYLDGVSPVVHSTNPVEFFIGAFSLWIHHEKFYFSIAKGVKFTCTFIQILRRLINDVSAFKNFGEIAALLAEMKALLQHRQLSKIPVPGIGGYSILQTIRLDQLFRVKAVESIRKLIALTYKIDALVAMANCTKKHEFILPEVKRGPPHIRAQGLIQPLLKCAVGNDVELHQKKHILFLTGPNMAGKSTYLRAVGTALYLGHLGMGVPAKTFSFSPVQKLFSAITIGDDLHNGVSYFQAEVLRVKAVAEAVAQGYSLVSLMDEPFKGTNVKDAFDATLALLQRFVEKNGCLFILSSHQIEISTDKRVATNVIDFKNFEAQECGEYLQFDYRLRPGVSSQRLGMRVLKEKGVLALLDGNQQPQ